MNFNFVFSTKNAFRNAFFVSAFTAMSVLTASAKSMPVLTPIASVSFVGSVDDQLSFLMNYENESGEKFVVNIVDVDGVSLFEGVFSDKKFAKTFRVPREVGNISFTISSYKNKADKKFQVTTERKMIEEITIK
jgi:hypothetical protein